MESDAKEKNNDDAIPQETTTTGTDHATVDTTDDACKTEPYTRNPLIKTSEHGTSEQDLESLRDIIDNESNITDCTRSLPNLLDINIKETISKSDSEQNTTQIADQTNSKLESKKLSHSFNGVLSSETSDTYPSCIDHEEEEEFGSNLSLDKLVKEKDNNKGMKNYLKSVFSKKIKSPGKSRKAKSDRAYKQF